MNIEETPNSTPQERMNALSGLEDMLPDDVLASMKNEQNPVKETPREVAPISDNEISRDTTNGEDADDELLASINKQEELVSTDPKEGGENNEEKQPVTNPIFGDLDLDADEANKSGEANTPATITSLMQDIGLKSEGELSEKVKAWQQTEQEYVQVKEQYDRVDNALNQLPPELYLAMQTALKGEDWRNVLETTPSIDFSKESTTVDAKVLIDTFMPNEFTEEDWEEYNDEAGDPATKKAINMALTISRERYDGKKNEIRSKISEDGKKSEEYQAKFTESLTRANEYVKRNLPGATDKFLNTINEKISKEGIVSQFYNPDGTLKESAVMLMLKTTNEYDEYVQIKTNKAVKEARTKMNQELLDRGNSTPNVRMETNSGTDRQRPEVKKKLNEIEDLFG